MGGGGVACDLFHSLPLFLCVYVMCMCVCVWVCNGAVSGMVGCVHACDLSFIFSPFLCHRNTSRTSQLSSKWYKYDFDSQLKTHQTFMKTLSQIHLIYCLLMNMEQGRGGGDGRGFW